MKHYYLNLDWKLNKLRNKFFELEGFESLNI